MTSSTDELFRRAIASLEARDLGAAERYFKDVLQQDPKHLAALNLLGIVLTQLEKNEDAERYLQAALEINSSSDATYYNYGVVLKALKRPNEALEKFSQALAINSTVAATWNNRGTVLNDLKRYKDAVADLDKAILLNANYSAAYCNKGKSLYELKRYDEALAAYEKALTLSSGLAEAWFGLGNVCDELDRHDDALAAYEKALTLKPDLAEAWLGRGNVYNELKRHDDALAAYEKALALKPDLAGAWLSRGIVYNELKRHDDALAAYEKALALTPDLAEAWLGRGIVYKDLKRHDQALAAFSKAQALKPDFAEAHFSEGLLRLLLGDMERGLEKYEFRWKTRERRKAKRDFSQPLWLGDNSITKKTILIHAEQGLGDTLLACRYVPMVAALGASVILEVQPSLTSLFRTLEGVSSLIARGDAIPDFDVHCPIMSLPLAFKTRLETIPAKVPYLKAPEELTERWRSRLGEGGFNIGVAWAGNPGFVDDRDRSILLENILPLFSVRGASFFSIQKDLRNHDQEILNAHPQIVQLGNEIKDFGDTAAIMMSLDLIISSDTSIINLAGALGRPVWVLLSFNPDWRWLLERNDSPWYPTASLFRQARAGHWETVVAEVCAQLEKDLGSHTSQ